MTDDKPENRVGKYLLRVGGRVAIISGHFKDFAGTVVEVETAEGVARRVGVELTVFGRSTRVDLSVDAVEPD